MLQPKFKVGDWVFCEFVLQQIKETKENRITSVTTGQMSLGSYDLSDRCFPLTIRIKNISDGIHYWNKRFHELKHSSLNHPDLNRELVKRWVEMCECRTDEELKKMYYSLDVFGKEICDKVNNLKYEEISGVRLFR